MSIPVKSYFCVYTTLSSGPTLLESCLLLTGGSLHCLRLGKFYTATFKQVAYFSSIQAKPDKSYFSVHTALYPQVLLCQSPVCCSLELVYTAYSQVSFYTASCLLDSILWLCMSISYKSYFCVYIAPSSQVLLYIYLFDQVICIFTAEYLKQYVSIFFGRLALPICQYIY